MDICEAKFTLTENKPLESALLFTLNAHMKRSRELLNDESAKQILDALLVQVHQEVHYLFSQDVEMAKSNSSSSVHLTKVFYRTKQEIEDVLSTSKKLGVHVEISELEEVEEDKEEEMDDGGDLADDGDNDDHDAQDTKEDEDYSND